MSGLEVLGAIASAAQLATYVVKAAIFLSDIHERLKSAPGRIAQHAHQIARLVEVVLYIKDNELIYTKLVFAQLEHTIEEASNLRKLLIKVLGQYTSPSIRKKYWNLLKGKNEVQILCALENLEREKTGLTLCLAAAQTELLYDVKREVRREETNTSNRMPDLVRVVDTMPLPSTEVLLPPVSKTPPEADQRQLGELTITRVNPHTEPHSNPPPVDESQAPHQQVADRDVDGPGGISEPAGNTNARAIRKIVIEDVKSTEEALQENDFGSSAKDGVSMDLKIKTVVASGKNTWQVNKW